MHLHAKITPLPLKLSFLIFLLKSCVQIEIYLICELFALFTQPLFPPTHHAHQLASSSSYIVPLCPVAAACMQGTGYSPGVKGHWCKPVQGKNTKCTNWCNTNKPSAKPDQCDTKQVEHHNTMCNARSGHRMMPSWCSKNKKLCNRESEKRICSKIRSRINHAVGR